MPEHLQAACRESEELSERLEDANLDGYDKEDPDLDDKTGEPHEPDEEDPSRPLDAQNVEESEIIELPRPSLENSEVNFIAEGDGEPHASPKLASSSDSDSAYTEPDIYEKDGKIHLGEFVCENWTERAFEECIRFFKHDHKDDQWIYLYLKSKYGKRVIQKYDIGVFREYWELKGCPENAKECFKDGW